MKTPPRVGSYQSALDVAGTELHLLGPGSQLLELDNI